MVICPHPNDATSFYRGVGPISRLQKDVPDLQCIFLSHVEYSSLAMCDAMFLQRPYQQSHLSALMLAKSQNVPIWLDYDDDLFSVAPDNPTFNQYGNRDTQERVRKCLEIADVVTVTTEHLRQQFLRFNKNIVVIPNAIDDYQFENRRPRPTSNVVLWRGGSTHQRDLMTVARQLVEVSRNPEHSAHWTFHFQGYNPWWITESMPAKNVRFAGSLSVIEYMEFMAELAPRIMIVPLMDNLFNRSKSNCSWIEGSYAGSAVIAPKQLPEFNRHGIINYSTPEEFAELLDAAMRGSLTLRECAEESWQVILKTATLSVVNPLRQSVLDSLTLRRRGFR